MNDNTGYVLKAKEETLFQGNYITRNNLFTGKIRSAVIYHDELYAKHVAEEMETFSPPYKGYKKEDLEIVPVTVQEV